MFRAFGRGSPSVHLETASSPTLPTGEAVEAARGLNRASGMLAGSALMDSAVEHYRGQFHNKAMYAPLISSALSLVAGVHGHADKRAAPHRARDAVYAASALVGLIGTGAHVYNIAKKPGGLSFQNLFYSAPIGAPAALVLSGLLGFLGERTRDNAPGAPPTVAGLPAGRFLAATTGVGLLGTVGEAGLLHYRGAYQNPFMYLPVTLPPVAAALLGIASAGKDRADRPVTRWWLRATALLGLAGAGFHIMGVGRGMGGWKNWRQNMIDGPPIPAPPSFTGLAIAGLAALGLIEGRR
jgi:hypothetical protein